MKRLWTSRRGMTGSMATKLLKVTAWIVGPFLILLVAGTAVVAPALLNLTGRALERELIVTSAREVFLFELSFGLLCALCHVASLGLVGLRLRDSRQTNLLRTWLAFLTLVLASALIGVGSRLGFLLRIFQDDMPYAVSVAGLGYFQWGVFAMIVGTVLIAASASAPRRSARLGHEVAADREPETDDEQG